CRSAETNARQTRGETRAAGEGGGGGGLGEGLGEMLPALVGVAAVGGMMYMMHKQNEAAEKAKLCALQPGPILDCSKANAFKYEGCDEHMQHYCPDTPSETGCMAFNDRYCGITGNEPPSDECTEGGIKAGASPTSGIGKLGAVG